MGNYIAMGTTPTIFISIKDEEGNNFNFADIIDNTFKVYFKQDYSLVEIIKAYPDIKVDSYLSRIEVTLSQEDTLKLKEGYVNIEARWLFDTLIEGTDKHVAGKTYIDKVEVGPVIKKEVIT